MHCWAEWVVLLQVAVIITAIVCAMFGLISFGASRLKRPGVVQCPRCNGSGSVDE